MLNKQLTNALQSHSKTAISHTHTCKQINKPMTKKNKGSYNRYQTTLNHAAEIIIKINLAKNTYNAKKA